MYAACIATGRTTGTTEGTGDENGQDGRRLAGLAL
jgi:hypothetical protein